MTERERIVYLIRHGSTHSHETNEVLRDEPLGVRGRAEADALSPQLASLPSIKVVLVSPLMRAMETAVRAFASRPDVKFIVEPNLREFNMQQKEKQPLYKRHEGSTIEALKAVFENKADKPDLFRANIQWPPNVGPKDSWWEPHGSFCRDRTTREETVYERVRSMAAKIYSIACVEAPAQIAVVAHENLFRAMSGCIAFRTAHIVQAAFCPYINYQHAKDNVAVTIVPSREHVLNLKSSWIPAAPDARPQSELPQAAALANADTSSSHALRHSAADINPKDGALARAAHSTQSLGPAVGHGATNQQQQLVGAAIAVPVMPAPMKDPAANVDGKPVVDGPDAPVTCRARRPSNFFRAFVALGCSTAPLQDQRLRHALGLLLGHPEAFLLVVCAASEMHAAVTFLRREIESKLLPYDQTWALYARIIVDADSFTTVDNATYAVQRLLFLVGPHVHDRHWSVHIVTHDWHMPRSLDIFLDVADRSAPWMHVKTDSCPAPFTDLMAYSDKHLLEIRYHIDAFKGDGSTDARLARLLAPGGAWRDWLARSRNLRVWINQKFAMPAAGTPQAQAIEDGKKALVGFFKDFAESKQPADARFKTLRVAVFDLLFHAAGFQRVGAVPLPYAYPLAHMGLRPDYSTALHFAAAYGAADLCRDLLFFFGCNAAAPNTAGDLPWALAKRGGHDFLAVMLRDAMHEQIELDDPGVLTACS